MSDQLENADEATELFFRAAMSKKRPASLIPCEKCFYCSETIKQGALFCGSECSADYEDEQRRKKIAGKNP